MKTCTELADDLGVSTTTVLRWADTAGIERTGSGVRRLWEEDEIRLVRLALLLQGDEQSQPGATDGRRSRWRAWREALPARRRPGGILLVYGNGSSRALPSLVEALPWVEDEGVTRLVRIPG